MLSICNHHTTFCVVIRTRESTTISDLGHFKFATIDSTSVRAPLPISLASIWPRSWEGSSPVTPARQPRSPDTDQLQLQADFYHERTKEAENDEDRTVPFPVKLWFVGYLMQYGLLRVKHIVFPSDVVDEMGSMGMLPPEKLSEMRVIDLVSEMVGLEEASPGVSQCQESDLQLDCVEVAIYEPSTQEGLNRFIALAPKELVIKLEYEVPAKSEGVLERWSEVLQLGHCALCLMSGVHLRLQSEAIETVRVEVGDVKEDEDAWPTFLPFLAASCPKLRLLDVRCILIAMGSDGWGLGDWIQRVVRSLQDEIFPELMRVCGADAVVNFEMRTWLPGWEIEEFLQRDHPVLRLGEPVHKPPSVVSRSIAVEREKEGEQPWHISFHIEEDEL